MPTYQYVCTACGQDLEAVQSFSDAALTDCPACAGRLRKKFGSVGVVFKGAGFYRNDSRSGNGASGNGASGAAAKSGEKPAEKTGDGAAPAAAKKESTTASTGSSSGSSSSSSSPSSSSGGSPASSAA